MSKFRSDEERPAPRYTSEPYRDESDKPDAPAAIEAARVFWDKTADAVYLRRDLEERLRRAAHRSAEELVAAGYPGSAEGLRAEPRGSALLEGPLSSPEACNARLLCRVAEVVVITYRPTYVGFGRDGEKVVFAERDDFDGPPVKGPIATDALRRVDHEVAALEAQRERLYKEAERERQRAVRRRGGRARADAFSERDDAIRNRAAWLVKHHPAWKLAEVVRAIQKDLPAGWPSGRRQLERILAPLFRRRSA